MDPVQFCKDLQDCMFTREYIDTWCKCSETPLKKSKITQYKTQESIDQTVIPAKLFRKDTRPQDTLFWCMVYIFDRGLYTDEISTATCFREYELKYKMIEQLNKITSVEEKNIRTRGYGNVRITRSKGYDPHLSIKELKAELSGSKKMSLYGCSSWLAYMNIPFDGFALVQYYDMKLAVPFGNTVMNERLTFEYSSMRNKKYILTRQQHTWSLTEVDTFPKCTYLSSISVKLRPLSNYSSSDLEFYSSMCNIQEKTKSKKYKAIQKWFHFRTCILIDYLLKE